MVMSVIQGGQTNYGFAVGILMLETKFPRIPGDIGNASTFSFPVLYRVVKGASPSRVVMEGDSGLIEPFLVAGRDLIKEGAKVIITGCGFLAKFQREFSQALSVPVFTSSLIQIPLVYHATGCRKVGILTVNAGALTKKHFESVGASGIPVAIEGIEKTHFGEVLLENRPELDVERAERDVVEAAKQLVSKNSDIGAIVLECTNLPPFAKSIQRQYRAACLRYCYPDQHGLRGRDEAGLQRDHVTYLSGLSRILH